MMSHAEPWDAASSRLIRWAGTISDLLRSAGLPVLFGLRLWVSVCLALYLAFWLELDSPSWAGTTAALVCQPQLGASLRKGWFRMIGTVLGAVVSVILTAWFPQSRIGFLVGLALWIAICALGAVVLSNFAAYAAALAGFTAAIIAADQLGSVGGLNGQAFILAVNRTSEICLGIVCAGIVLAATDLGTARRRLAGQFAALAAEIAGRMSGALRLAGPDQAETREVRRDLVRRVIALDPIIDQAIGESSNLRYRSRLLQAAVEGLFAALSAWRIFALHLEHRPTDESRRDAETVWRQLPQELRAAAAEGVAEWMATPARLCRICGAAVRAVLKLPASTAAQRALADRAAEGLIGISRALDGVTLLVADPSGPVEQPRTAKLHVPDWLPAGVSAARALAVVGAFELFWIITAWPGGAAAIIWAAVGVTMFAARADQAYATAVAFAIGTFLAVVAAAIVNFAILPNITSFVGFGAVIGMYLVPVAALMAQPCQTAMFQAMAGVFIPLLAPQNLNAYNTQQFYNAALGIAAGLIIAALSFRLLPPPSPAVRTRRLLSLSLRGLRRLARRQLPPTADQWRGRMYSRLRAMPEDARPEQRSQLAAALAVGDAIIRLRRVAGRLGVEVELDHALAAVARGDSALAVQHLAQLDATLGAQPADAPGAAVRLRARAGVLAMDEALTEYPGYFDAAESG